MKKVAILTTGRSDFGPLRRVVQHAAMRFDVDLLVAGSHFLRSRGETVREIEKDLPPSGNLRLVPFDVMAEIDTPAQQVACIANTQHLAASWFESNPYDALLFLGDRWELWGMTLPAFLFGIPLAHISGGEVTEGVIDDCVRHSHTKIAGLHFAAASEYARNISRMGEEDWRISVVGECGLDLIHDGDLADPAEIGSAFAIDLSRETILVTFHPSTLDLDTPVAEQVGPLLGALNEFKDRQLVFTAPGVEQGARVVLDAIERFVASHPNARLVHHFGSRNYLAVMKHASAVIGNSSSGLTEAPSLGVPAINIGSRQKNRLAAQSVQHVGYSAESIRDALNRALTPDYRNYARRCQNPYDPFRDGRNSLRIVEALDRALSDLPRDRLRVKKFNTRVISRQWNHLLK